LVFSAALTHNLPFSDTFIYQKRPAKLAQSQFP